MPILELLQRELPVNTSDNPLRLSRLQMDMLIDKISQLWTPVTRPSSRRQTFYMSREQLSMVESPQRGITTDLIFDQCPAIRVGPDGMLHWRIVTGSSKLHWTCSLDVPVGTL